MKGHVAKKGNRYYAVVYEGLDPISGKRSASGTPPAPAGTRPKPSPANSQMRSAA